MNNEFPKIFQKIKGHTEFIPINAIYAGTLCKATSTAVFLRSQNKKN